MTTAQTCLKLVFSICFAESLILVCQERSDAETARRVISQTFIYRQCAAPCQQSQYLHLHNFILYETADSGRPYIWVMNL